MVRFHDLVPYRARLWKEEGASWVRGYIQFLEYRRELELQIIEQLPFQSFVMDNSDYDWVNQQQTVSNIMMKYL